MKIIVTHFSPDFDAIAASWLIKRYMAGWQKAELRFVPAGETSDNQPVDSNSDIIHVDTGLGRFDHHQTKNKTSSARLVFDYLTINKRVQKKDLPALERLVELVTMIDNFNEIFLANPTDDIYDLGLPQLIEGLKSITGDDKKTCDWGFTLLEAALIGFKNKVKGEEEIKKGFVFRSKWGKTLAMENGIEESVKLALKNNFFLVIRKNPENGILRIKARPDCRLGLDRIYQKVKKIDPKATWYLHPSNRILLNGSTKNPKTKPTFLRLTQIIEIIKEIT